jgi:glutaredoxin
MKTVTKAVLGLLGLLVAVSGSVQAEIYHWVDDQGKRHFGDRPPVEYQAEKVVVIENTVETRVVNGNKLDEVDKPVANKSVTMYSAAWCGICKQAAKYFRENKIPFKEYDVDKSSKGQRDFQKLKGRGVPIILVGEQRMDGFSPERFKALYR